VIIRLEAVPEMGGGSLLTFRNSRIFRSSSKENVLFIGLADLALSIGRIDGGLFSRSVLEGVSVSV